MYHDLRLALPPNILSLVEVSRERNRMKVWGYFDVFHFVFNRCFDHD